MLSRLKKIFDGARDRWNAIGHVMDTGLQARTSTVRSRWVLFIAEVIRQVRRDDVSLMAAGVAYYAVLSVLPLGVALSGVLGLIADSETVQDAVESFFAIYVPAASGDFLDQLGGRSAAANSISAAVGLIGLLWTGTAMLSALAKAINRAHGIRQDRPFYLGRPRALLLGATVFIAFGISVYSSAAITAASQFNVPLLGELTALQWMARVPPLVLTFTTFALTYQLLPNKRTRWRNSLPAAAVAAAGFEAAKSLFVFYLDRADYGSVYGVFGSVVAFMVWSYFSAFIVLVGAEVAAVRAHLQDAEVAPPPLEMPTGP